MEGNGESILRSGRVCVDAAVGQSGHCRGSGCQLGYSWRAGCGWANCIPVLLGGQDVRGGEEVNKGNEDSRTILRTISTDAHLRKSVLTQGLILYSAVYITP